MSHTEAVWNAQNNNINKSRSILIQERKKNKQEIRSYAGFFPFYDPRMKAASFLHLIETSSLSSFRGAITGCFQPIVGQQADGGSLLISVGWFISISSGHRVDILFPRREGCLSAVIDIQRHRTTRGLSHPSSANHRAAPVELTLPSVGDWSPDFSGMEWTAFWHFVQLQNDNCIKENQSNIVFRSYECALCWFY